jgi:ankyrin repeat protein
VKRQYSLILLAGLTCCFSPGCDSYFGSHQDTTLYTDIFPAAEAGDLPKVKTLVEKKPEVANARGMGGLSPLHLAVLHDHKEVVTYLLDKSANVNARSDVGLTPLHAAAQNGNIVILGILLDRRAEINVEESQGWTPLDYAEKWEEPEAAAFLKNRGAGHGSGYRP